MDAESTEPMLDRILPLSEVRRAHKLSKSGHTNGKIVPRIRNGNGTTERKQSRFVCSSLREFAKNSRISGYLRQSENTIMRRFPS
jgi:zinc-binding alcohol dehydrogenase family protein